MQVAQFWLYAFRGNYANENRFILSVDRAILYMFKFILLKVCNVIDNEHY